MHLSTVHNSRFYAAAKGSTESSAAVASALVRRSTDGASNSSKWIAIFAMVGGIIGVALLVAFIWRCVIAHPPGRKHARRKQQDKWYGH